MKKLPLVLALVFIVWFLLAVFWPRIITWESWYVEPAPDWKWRSVLTEHTLFGSSSGGSSPMSYDEALWWAETKGGKLMGGLTYRGRLGSVWLPVMPDSGLLEERLFDKSLTAPPETLLITSEAGKVVYLLPTKK